MASGPALLGELRDALFDHVLGLLKADPAVDGVAVIGSLGRGEADDWSDIDLLVLMGDQALARFADNPAVSPWARADLLVDGRHNSPAGAVSIGATHVRSGLPVRVDLHVHAAARTRWPTDSRVAFERRPVEPGTQSFDEVNASGRRQPATTKTADEIRMIHLSYVPAAGKYIGRRSPRAIQMIRFLGQVPDFADEDPAAQLHAVRGIVRDLSDPSWAWLSHAVTAYLDVVGATLEPRTQ
jgi:nucleotidyltransferase-like protein